MLFRIQVLFEHFWGLVSPPAVLAVVVLLGLDGRGTAEEIFLFLLEEVLGDRGKLGSLSSSVVNMKLCG